MPLAIPEVILAPFNLVPSTVLGCEDSSEDTISELVEDSGECMSNSNSCDRRESSGRIAQEGAKSGAPAMNEHSLAEE